MTRIGYPLLLLGWRKPIQFTPRLPDTHSNRARRMLDSRYAGIRSSPCALPQTIF
jgi:hypothetical protein